MSKQTLFNIIIACISAASLFISVVSLNKTETQEEWRNLIAEDFGNLVITTTNGDKESWENQKILRAHINRLNKMNGFEPIEVESEE